jgi:hypothetical protein
MLIDVAVPRDTNVIEKEGGEILRYIRTFSACGV